MRVKRSRPQPLELEPPQLLPGVSPVGVIQTVDQISCRSQGRKLCKLAAGESAYLPRHLDMRVRWTHDALGRLVAVSVLEALPSDEEEEGPVLTAYQRRKLREAELAAQRRQAKKAASAAAKAAAASPPPVQQQEQVQEQQQQQQGPALASGLDLLAAELEDAAGLLLLGVETRLPAGADAATAAGIEAQAAAGGGEPGVAPSGRAVRQARARGHARRVAAAAAAAALKAGTGRKACAVCGATSSPAWRRDDQGQRLCNSCGLHYKLKQCHKVVEAPAVVVPLRVVRRRVGEGGSAGRAGPDGTASGGGGSSRGKDTNAPKATPAGAAGETAAAALAASEVLVAAAASDGAAVGVERQAVQQRCRKGSGLGTGPRAGADAQPRPDSKGTSTAAVSRSDSMSALAAAAGDAAPTAPSAGRKAATAAPAAAAAAAAAAKSYTRIKRNVYVGRQPRLVLPEEEVAVCGCDPAAGQACRPEDGCLNRMLRVACTPGHCRCGPSCTNTPAARKASAAPLRLVALPGKGVGAVAKAAIPAGAFVAEYLGEVVPLQEGLRRLAAYKAAGASHTYVMDLSATEVIDATTKGGPARFINHACQPNCETQKWQVGGELAVYIVATRDIAPGEEVTYDYRYESLSVTDRQRCACGAPSCSGWLGRVTAGAALVTQAAPVQAGVVVKVDEWGHQYVEDVLPPLDSDSD